MRKRWRYVGVYGPELSLCVGVVAVGPFRQAFWATWDRVGGHLDERTTHRSGGVRLPPGRVLVSARDVSIDLRFDEEGGDRVETVTRYGAGYAWTAKRGGVPIHGRVRTGGRDHRIDGLAVIDDSAGYPPRHTRWQWSAGIGQDAAGHPVAWNLVSGIHDDPVASERTVWVDGVARHVAPVRFAADLSAVDDTPVARADEATAARPGDVPPARPGEGTATRSGGDRTAPDESGVALRFAREATRRRDERLVLLRSSYEQPFGTFTGTLPGGVELRCGFGVMEDHDAVW